MPTPELLGWLSFDPRYALRDQSGASPCRWVFRFLLFPRHRCKVDWVIRHPRMDCGDRQSQEGKQKTFHDDSLPHRYPSGKIDKMIESGMERGGMSDMAGGRDRDLGGVFSDE